MWHTLWGEIFEIVESDITFPQIDIVTSFDVIWIHCKFILEESEGMMINVKVVRNVVKTGPHYGIFPLAVIFGTPQILPLKYEGAIFERYQI